LVSWRFFSAKADYQFCDWNFAGSTTEEAANLFAILKAQGHESYMAVFEDLGAPVCRILVPGYSEIYPVEDLVWDNTNIALDFRDDILDLHQLSDKALAKLLRRLDDCERDIYTKIITLIGIEFDENTVWGQLTILELKLLINLALGHLEDAMEQVEQFLQFNDNTVERVRFYQALHVVLEVTLDDDLNLDDYVLNFGRMFGEERLKAALESVSGRCRFYGLTPTNMALDGLEKHLRLIDSYKKLHAARAKSGK
jgi:ribosomal protein S12 methylthiotransferase accessory factor